jgi:SNF2 family DNA or RNA helicase
MVLYNVLLLPEYGSILNEWGVVLYDGRLSLKERNALLEKVQAPDNKKWIFLTTYKVYFI